MRRDLDLQAGGQERVLDAARFTYKLAADHFLGPFEKDLNDYVERLTRAYDKVDAALKKAKAAEERWHKRRDLLLGVAIGTGVGLVAGEIFGSAKGFWKLVVEVGGELSEWLLAQGADLAKITVPPSNWDIPVTVRPHVQQLAHTKKLLDAWKGVALVQATSMNVVEIQKAVRQQDRTLDSIEGELTLRDIEGRVQSLKAKDPEQKMIGKLLDVRFNLHAFRNAAEYGVKRSEYRLEQDIWIAWIKSLGPSPDDTGWGGRGYHEAIRDVKDELEEAGVWHRLGRSDLGAAPDEAARDERARTHLDRLAVVIAPMGTGGEAVVRFRHDAYRGAPERDPDPTGEESYIRVGSTTGRALTSGEVVKVNDVHHGQPQVFTTGWGTRPVSSAEIAYVRDMTMGRAL